MLASWLPGLIQEGAMPPPEKEKPPKYSLSTHGQPGEREYLLPQEFDNPFLDNAALEYNLRQEKAKAERRALRRSLIPSAR